MWIEEVTNAKGTRYKYCERFTHPVTRRAVKISVTLNNNTQRAQRAALQMLREKFAEKTKTADEKRREKLERLTMAQVLDEWHDLTRCRIKMTTAKHHGYAVEKIKKELPPGLLFVDFTPAMAERIVYELYYKKLRSFSYAKSILSVIRNAMRYAKKARYADDIAAFEEIELRKRPATPGELQKKANKFLNKDEMRQCLEQLRPNYPRIAMAMEFITLTGLRGGELLALRVQDYDKARQCVHVTGTIISGVPNGSDEQRGTPKNAYSYRDVYLNRRAMYILDWFIMENKRAALWSQGRYVDRGYIFTTATGFPYDLSTINKRLQTVHIEGKKLTTHIFRHTHISLLAEQGIPLKAIMQRVGHNDPNTTLSIYTHVTDAMNKEARQKIDAIAAL